VYRDTLLQLLEPVQHDVDLRGRALMATSRLSLVSRARYTSPIPPALSSNVIS
jgi:hypothetical protein